MSSFDDFFKNLRKELNASVEEMEGSLKKSADAAKAKSEADAEEAKKAEEAKVAKDKVDAEKAESEKTDKASEPVYATQEEVKKLADRLDTVLAHFEKAVEKDEEKGVEEKSAGTIEKMSEDVQAVAEVVAKMFEDMTDLKNAQVLRKSTHTQDGLEAVKKDSSQSPFAGNSWRNTFKSMASTNKVLVEKS